MSNNMHDIMVDLETLGTYNDTVILSIGAVYFNRDTGETGQEFYTVLAKNSGANKERTVSGDTLEWWETQSRKVYDKAMSGTTDLEDALIGLRKFIHPKCKVWGNGATFDISILEDAYIQTSQAIPWKFWNVRDVRTVVDIASEMVGKGKQPKDLHDPVVDCKYQIKYICEMIAILRG